MRYQDRIYNQNGNNIRNRTIALPNTSSDISTFEIPLFTMSGASKIDCSEVICDLSGVSYTNILTATTDCFISNGLDGSCFNNINWNTNIYEDDNLVYSEQFYKSSHIGDIANESSFTGSVVTAFKDLKYDYSMSGSQYTLSQKGFNNLKIEIETEIKYDNNCLITGGTATGETYCYCPSGYDLTPANDACQKIITTAATFNGAGISVSPGDTSIAYSFDGAYFYQDITNITDLPITRSADVIDLETQSGGTITWTDRNNNPANTFWKNASTTTDGRLNNVGITASTSEFLGFSDCIDINTGGLYYVALAADNLFKFSIDGELILEFNIDHTKNFKIWHVFPYTFSSGKHIIEMQGKNDSLDASFGAEIYNPTDFATLTGATTTGDTGLIFSTFDRIGTNFDVGDTMGYSCPTGYALDFCDTTPKCSKILNTGTTCVFTGTCSGDTEVVCDLEFSGLTSGDTNVHIITGQTDIELNFTFTENLQNLSGNTVFKYDIHKYNNSVNKFFKNPVYTSEEFYWKDFSGTSAFSATVKVDDIDVDGDYLVRGYYIHDALTQYQSLLGTKLVSPKISMGSEYSIYQPYKDFYFTSFTPAEKPKLNDFSTDTGSNLGALTVNSQILDGSTNSFVIGNSYGRYIVSLNGITLGETLDYTLEEINTEDVNSTGTTTYPTVVLNLSGDTKKGDILTIGRVGKETTGRSIIYDNHIIDKPIISGDTNNQGDEFIYYNTTTSKYEMYTKYEISESNDVIVTLNGVKLANNIDYFKSTSDPRRIIFMGEILVGDIVNIFYNSDGSLVGNINTTTLGVSWNLDKTPKDTNGLFTLELSDEKDFINILSSEDVNYITNISTYQATIPLNGSAGDVRYYRVKNKKSYIDMCGNPIITIAHSKVNEITIQTNADNSY